MLRPLIKTLFRRSAARPKKLKAKILLVLSLSRSLSYSSAENEPHAVLAFMFAQRTKTNLFPNKAPPQNTLAWYIILNTTGNTNNHA
jgi:hypothetical protein